MRDGVRARSPEARVHDGKEGWGEGFVAREPHTETITLSLDYGAALSPPGSLRFDMRDLETRSATWIPGRVYPGVLTASWLDSEGLG
jgi:hypothetical protein